MISSTSICAPKAEVGSERVLSWLIEAKADANVEHTPDVTTALVYAARQGHWRCVLRLLASGAHDRVGNALAAAKEHNRTAVVEILKYACSKPCNTSACVF